MLYDQPPAPIVQCVNCNDNEKATLKFLQKRGIRGVNALATVMGNIKAESGFKTNICEGGARVPYNRCMRGGFGLIQWTTENRYFGLGRFCRKYNCNPNSLDGQLRYMVNESQWKQLEPILKKSGRSIEYYMDKSWYWLGWGIHGNRTRYAYNYASRFKTVVPVAQVSTIHPIAPPPPVL
jgi:hypothetical protein